MPYYLRGNLWGYICRECPRPLWGVVVRAYAAEDDRLIERVAADPKQTASAIDEKAVKARSGRLLAEAEVGEDGSFELDFSRSKYQGGPVEIDLRMEGLPRIDERTAKSDPRQIQLTTLQPTWRERERDFIAFWEYYLPSRLWCLILSWFDIWVICGRVTICETHKPIGGVIVEARDVDWLQDDYLGSALTDSTGRFVIYYPGSAFRAGTWINVELFGGPDLYFTIKTQSNMVLLAEPPSRGRQPDRENVGNCFCVELCLKDMPGIDEGLAVFTNIGHYDYISDVDSGVGQSGLTKASSLNSSDVRAFFHTMRLNGQLFKTLNGFQMEYCFEWREVTAAGAPITTWTQVTQSQIARTVIGKWAYFETGPNIWHFKDYTVNGTVGPFELVASFTGDGWIKVPQESSYFTPTGFFQPNGNQINLISPSLVPFGSFNMTGKVAGASAAPLGANRYFGLRMLARSNGVNQIPSAGTCNQVAINNKGYDNLQHHPSWAGYTSPPGTLGVNLLDIQELQVNGCSEIQNALTILMTAAHPTMGAVSLSMAGNAFSGTFTLPAAVPGQQFGTVTNNFSVPNLPPCAYIVTLSTQLMLTTGDSVPSNLVDQIAFCKAPPP
jgi:hypothetical protein